MKSAEWTGQCALPAECLSLGFVVNTLTCCLFVALPVRQTLLPQILFIMYSTDDEYQTLSVK